MCTPGFDPISIGIMLGTKAMSGFLQNKAQDAVISKRRSVYDAAEKDIGKFRARATQDLQKSIQKGGAESIQAQQTKDVEAREKKYTDTIQQEDLMPAQKRGSEASIRAIASALDEAFATSKDRAGRKARLDAYGDTLLDRDITYGRSRQNIAQQGNYSSGRANVAQAELADANSAGAKYANLAGLVDAVGTIGSAASGFGAGQGWWGGLDPKTGINWKGPRVGAI